MESVNNALPKWEDFSAFTDVGDMDHYLYMIEENLLECIYEELYKRLIIQNEASEKIINAECEDIYTDTWGSLVIGNLLYSLHELLYNPHTYEEKLPYLVIDLHRVYIAAHEIYDPRHRAMIIERAKNNSSKFMAAKRHKENYQLTEFASEYWRKNIDPELSAEKAATILEGVVKLSHKTLAALVSKLKKQLKQQ